MKSASLPKFVCANPVNASLVVLTCERSFSCLLFQLLCQLESQGVLTSCRESEDNVQSLVYSPFLSKYTPIRLSIHVFSIWRIVARYIAVISTLSISMHCSTNFTDITANLFLLILVCSRKLSLPERLYRKILTRPRENCSKDCKRIIAIGSQVEE